MEGLKLEIFNWLIELDNVEGANFLRICEIESIFVDIAFGWSDDRETQIHDVIIRLPLKKFKSINDYSVPIGSIESAIKESAQAQNIHIRSIDWAPMLSSGKVINVQSNVVIDHQFINEQISKCRNKIEEADYNGAITNARSLIEAVCIELVERIELTEIKNDGNLDNLWSRTKKAMKLEMNKNDLPDTVNQILGGIDTAVKGLAGLSNNAGDRHANKFKTRRHHAQLAVNLSLAISDFLFESLEYQIELRSKSLKNSIN